MKTVKGVYENGEIKLLEKTSIAGSKKVLVTFIDEEEENEETAIRDISLQYSSQTLEDYINDEREDLYQDFLK
ncbi:MAG: DUF104 domain-containing protein [Chitinophagaceae bacterium]|nr:DUF104 domain-containing protein [Chitinophagaceae bacterium]